MKVTAKLTLAVLLCLVSALSLRGCFEIRERERAYRSETSAELALIGRALRPAAAEVLRSDGRDHALRVIREADQRMSGVDIRWVSLVRGGDPAELPGTPIAALESVRRGHDAIHLLAAEQPGEGRIYTYAPVHVGEANDAAIEVSQSLAGEGEVRREAVRNTLGAAGLATLAAAVAMSSLGFWFVGRPIRRLSEHARRVGAGDLSQRIPVQQRDEIGALAADMNRMTEQLAESQASAGRANDAKIRALEQLRHADRLATVGRLAAGLAHELGTPLNVAQARARSIAERRADGDLAVSYASIIVEQVDRMTRLIRQLLDFARKRDLRKEAADLGHIVRRSVALTGPMAEKRGVVVDILTPPEVILRVDASQIEQVVTNLLTNAIHASRRGQEVFVKVSADSGAGSETTGAIVEVADRGEGIAAEHIPRIFEPFFTTKDVGEGTGLGLSVAYGIVQDHGGWIEVESTPGSGSCFRVHFGESSA